MEHRFSVSKLREYLVQHSDARIVFLDEAGRNETSYRNLANMVGERVAKLERLPGTSRRRIGILGSNSLNWMAWDLACIANGDVPIAFLDEHALLPKQNLMAKYGCHLILAEASGDSKVLEFEPPQGEPDSMDNPDVLTLVFSSGTTGRTKGLTISHVGLEHILDQFIDGYRVTGRDRYYSFLPFNYFQQRALYYAALSVGADIVVAPASRFIHGFSSERPSYCVNPPAVYEAIYRHYSALEKLGRATTLQQFLGGNIRWMITAMAPISRQVLDFFWDHGVGLYETYGVTETGLVAWNTLRDYKIGTVGKAAADGEIHLAENGEVLIKRKKPLALGYFDVGVERERDVFREDGSISTGDIASIDADGYLTLIGRTKNAIVTGKGQKFHPEEIERQIEARLGGCVAVVVGGAQVCENTLIAAPRAMDDHARVSPADLLSNADDLNRSLDHYKKVREVYLLKEPFSPANGFMTRNMKLDRANIQRALLSGELLAFRVQSGDRLQTGDRLQSGGRDA